MTLNDEVLRTSQLRYMLISSFIGKNSILFACHLAHGLSCFFVFGGFVGIHSFAFPVKYHIMLYFFFSFKRHVAAVQSPDRVETLLRQLTWSVRSTQEACRRAYLSETSYADTILPFPRCWWKFCEFTLIQRPSLGWTLIPPPLHSCYPHGNSFVPIFLFISL